MDPSRCLLLCRFLIKYFKRYHTLQVICSPKSLPVFPAGDILSRSGAAAHPSPLGTSSPGTFRTSPPFDVLLCSPRGAMMTYGPSATITSLSPGSWSLPSGSGAGKPSREPNLDISARLAQELKEAGEGVPCAPEGSPPPSSCSGFCVGFPSEGRQDAEPS